MAPPEAVPMPDAVLDQPLYDSGSIATGAATTKLSFFTQPVNQGTSAFQSGAKTFVDTNMRQAATLPAGWKMEVKAIALVLWTTALTMAADMALVLANCFYRFSMGGAVEWLLVPAKIITGGAGVDGFATDTNATVTRQGAHNGLADPRAVYGLSIPIVIPGQQSFEATLEWPTGPSPTAAVPVTNLLHGILNRRA